MGPRGGLSLKVQSGCTVIRLLKAGYCTDEKEMNLFDRDDWIRTSDLCVPNAALYQAEPRPDLIVPLI